jgi:CMP-N,N'-diacetyllegionaminic acid synthase
MRVALIPARAGSKGIPRKNIKNLCGKPLISYTISAALRSNIFDQVVVSTESAEIAEVAAGLGASVPYLRPEVLSGDKTPAVDVILHALDCIDNISDLMYLQPTSPLRSSRHIREAFELRKASNCECIVSVTKAKKPMSWYVGRSNNNMLRMLSNGLEHSRQEAVGEYIFNGAIYLSTASYIRRVGGFIGDSTCLMEMAPEDSVDIDDELDWVLCKHLIKQQGR